MSTLHMIMAAAGAAQPIVTLTPTQVRNVYDQQPTLSSSLYAVGDIVFLLERYFYDNATAADISTGNGGWTRIEVFWMNSTVLSGALFYKVLTSGDLDVPTAKQSLSRDNRSMAIGYRPSVPCAVVVRSKTYNFSAAQPPAITIDPTGVVGAGIALAVSLTNSSILSFAPTSEIYETADGASYYLNLKAKSYASNIPKVTHSCGAPDSGSFNALFGGYIDVVPL